MIFAFLWFLSSVLVSLEGSTPSSSAAVNDSAAIAEPENPAGVGTVAELQGEAYAAAEGFPKRALAEGDPVYLNETITTGPDSSAQIELADESLFSLSAESSIRIDKFSFDQEGQDNNLVAYLAKGIFRFITGKIAEENPENVELDFPSAILGVRGTVVVGEISGERCLISLEAEEGGKTQHRIVVANKGGEKIEEVEIAAPGFATVIEAQGRPPMPAFQMPPQERMRLQETIPPPKFLPRDHEGRAVHNQNVKLPPDFGKPQPQGRRERREDEQKIFDRPPPGGGPGPNRPGSEFSPHSFPGSPPQRPVGFPSAPHPGPPGQPQFAGRPPSGQAAGPRPSAERTQAQPAGRGPER